MREYKFRAWDNVANEMLYAGEDTDVIFVLGSSGIECTDIRNGTPSGDGIDSMDHLIYMQFTGLKDRNGEEVFENDIIQLPYTDTIHIIEWDAEEACFALVVRSTVREFYIYDMDYISEYEVIGNIHENPELLEATP